MEIYLYSALGNLQKVKECLGEGEYINILSVYRYTALMQASTHGHINVVKYLISKGAHPNIQSGYGYTALMWASKYGFLETVKYLISKGADINIQNGNGNTAINLSSMNYYRNNVDNYLTSLKGPLSLQHIALNLIEEKNIPHENLPEILFMR